MRLQERHFVFNTKRQFEAESGAICVLQLYSPIRALGGVTNAGEV